MAAEKEIILEFDREFYKNRTQALMEPAIEQFLRVIKSYTLFNIFFLSLLSAEIIYFFIHLTFLAQTFVLAIHLALIVATIFSYFTLKVYFESRKTEQLMDLKSDFIHACELNIQDLEDSPEYHLTIAYACCRLAADLHGKEYVIYQVPFRLNFLFPMIEKISCWVHWQDVHTMKELLLQGCIEEHIKLVRLEPTDLEAHTGLANAYVMLSGLYVDPRTIEGLDDDRWLPANKYNESFQLKFRYIAERAIEEFKILSDYAPQDPWVHAQLAYSYHDLQMPEEEIKEYEIILQLCPEDKETLFKLGKLYFEQGLNAKGLQIYEILKKSNYKKAESLIHFYGAYAI
ncbi:tetratricopeptide repeat protein [Candidatus Protochlamydia amoebophila]|uniref:Uncharacterized protein n=1 Tax=Protochlamydia amoebophila (strain UWE25) TaxID=264201 RepID=Q6MA18_PARUW|nr:hypothetical protein [Candidatus Protochlamydia amoebophila]CAF24581.1 unnamed protein product [Candidatus Protochlamydia amoebophila UWE25]